MISLSQLAKPSPKYPIYMRTIKLEYIITAPLEKVWKAFIDPKEIEKWGGGPAKMTGREGAKFSLWDGEIYGTNTRVVEKELLEQDWFGGDWSEPSKVRFEFSFRDGRTKVVLLQTGMPDSEVENLTDGWRDYYLGPMQEYLES